MAAAKPRNGEISCSIEETNRIRLSLGLKPLRETPAAEPKPTAPKLKPNPIPKPVSSTSKKQSSFFDLAETDSDSDGDTGANLLDWVNRSRNSTASKVQPKPNPDANNPSANDKVQNDVQLSLPEVPHLEEGDSMVFTLADADVCGEEEDLLQIPGAPGKNSADKNEIGQVGDDGKPRGMKISFPDGEASKPSKSLSKEPTKTDLDEQAKAEKSVTFAQPKVESDYKGDPFKAVAQKSRVQKPRKKRKRRRESRKDEGTADSNGAKVSKGHMAALRAKASSQIVDDDDDDEHYVSLARAHRLSKEKRLSKASEIVLNAIERVTEENLDDADRDGSMKIVYDEMQQFMHSIPVAEVPSDSEEERVHPPVRSDSKPIPKPEPSENTPKSEPIIEEKKDINMENTLPTAPLDIPEDSTGHMSVAATLQRLRAMGELKDKHVQRGRARDARLSEVAPDIMEARDVKLSYMDDFGNELTPKEAFRVLCHKFHGHKPGQNKKEKRMRKMLEDLRVQQMQSDDTPLASAAALKEETRKLGSAHVVLSGSRALLQQTLERPVLTKSVEKPRLADSSNRSAGRKNGAQGGVDGKMNGVEEEREEKKVTFSFGIQGNGAMKRRRR